MGTAVDPKLDVVRRVSFIACNSLLVPKTKTIHFDEEQIHSSPASSSHGRLSASRRTSDHEDLIARNENLLVVDYRSRLPVYNFPIHPQK